VPKQRPTPRAHWRLFSSFVLALIMPLSSADLHELGLIDRQIEAMLNEDTASPSIYSLRTHRNALASALCRLPTDVAHDLLRYIVLSSKIHDSYPFPTFYASETIIPWTNITSACSSLRALAISLPTLWCFIDLNRCTEWTNLCIERSHGVPIHISCFFRGARLPVLAMHLNLLLPRACEARLSPTNGRGLSEEIRRQLQEPLPVLREFYCQHRAPFTFSLSGTFLGGQTFSLTRLELRRVNIEDDSLRFPGLKTLFLASITADDQPKRLLRLIQASPRLEHLSLSSIHDPAPDQALGLIQLPCLLTSHIAAKLSWIVVFLDSLPVPQNKYEASVEIERSISDITPAKIALRRRALESFMRVARILGDQALTTSLELDASWTKFGKTFWALTLRSPPTWPCLVTFTDVYMTIEGLTPIMSLTKSVTVHANAAKAFISHVTIRPGAFGSLEHVVLKQDPDGPWRGYEGFLAWLRLRQDLGEPLRGLDIHGTSPLHALGVDAGTLVRCGMVGEVMQDGRKI
jgi:hypothetical protein